MIFGRWSKFKLVIGLLREPTVRCAETIASSVEEIGPVRGFLVGLSSLRRVSSLLMRWLAIVVPLKDAWLSAVWETQVWL